VRGAHLDLGLALAKQGHADEAAAEGLLALADYVPRTWILRRARDLDRALRARGEVREVRTSISTTSLPGVAASPRLTGELVQVVVCWDGAGTSRGCDAGPFTMMDMNSSR
jgi:hypothetical protein